MSREPVRGPEHPDQNQQQQEDGWDTIKKVEIGRGRGTNRDVPDQPDDDED